MSLPHTLDAAKESRTTKKLESAIRTIAAERLKRPFATTKLANMRRSLLSAAKPASELANTTPSPSANLKSVISEAKALEAELVRAWEGRTQGSQRCTEPLGGVCSSRPTLQ